MDILVQQFESITINQFKNDNVNIIYIDNKLKTLSFIPSSTFIGILTGKLYNVYEIDNTMNSDSWITVDDETILDTSFDKNNILNKITYNELNETKINCCINKDINYYTGNVFIKLYSITDIVANSELSLL